MRTIPDGEPFIVKKKIVYGLMVFLSSVIISYINVLRNSLFAAVIVYIVSNDMVINIYFGVN